MARFKSWRSFSDFEREVRRALRYVRTTEQEKFLRTVLETSQHRQVQLKAGHIFYRAQIGFEWREVDQDGDTFEVQCALSPTRMKPLPDRASEGRANAKGIPCLYLATAEKTAILEVRPWIGSYVSVGQFKLMEDCTLIDCSRNHDGFPFFFEEPKPLDREKAVWSQIDRAFAEPTSRQDDIADYAPTQIIAELFKRNGFDGVAYKSNFGEKGYNVALFDLDAADILNCILHKIDKVDVEYNQVDGPYFISKHYPSLQKSLDETAAVDEPANEET